MNANLLNTRIQPLSFASTNVFSRSALYSTLIVAIVFVILIAYYATETVPTDDPDVVAASPLADIIGGRLRLTRFRYIILPILTMLVGAIFLLAPALGFADTEGGTGKGVLYGLVFALVIALVVSGLTPVQHDSIFGLADNFTSNGIYTATLAVIIGIMGQYGSPEMRNYVLLATALVLSIFWQSISTVAITTTSVATVLGIFFATTRTTQGITFLLGGLVSLIPTIVGEWTRRAIGVSELLTNKVALDTMTPIASSHLTPQAKNPLGRYGCTQRIRFRLPTDIPSGVTGALTPLFRRLQHFAAKYNAQTGEIVFETTPVSQVPDVDSTFRWQAPVGVPIDLVISMGEYGIVITQNGKTVAKNARVTYVPEAATNLELGQQGGVPGEVDSVSFIGMPLGEAQIASITF